MFTKFMDAVKLTEKMADEEKPVSSGWECIHAESRLGQTILSIFC